MHRTLSQTLFLVAGIILCLPTAGWAEYKPLFDGKTFDGWEGDTAKTWRIEDGAIVGGSLEEKVPRNEFLCTKKSYGDFELKVKFKMLGDRKTANAGVQFRTKRIPNHHEVSGYQADVGQQYWGALYDESRRKKVLVQPDPKVLEGLVKHDDWNEYRIRCEGPRIRLWLNGTLTVDYTEKDDKIERTGIIGLQVHGGGKTKVFYKDIQIEELIPTPKKECEEAEARPNYRTSMRQFVQAISAAAKKASPAFLVVPQGGIGLLTDSGDPAGKPVAEYLKAIDGVGQEEVFYGYDNKDNRKTPKKETDYFLKQLLVAKNAGKVVLSTDYASKQELIDDAYARNKAAGFVAFVADRRGLDRVPKYPAKPINENAADVKSLKDVKNFLYVIDGGKFGSKEKYLAALAKTNHDLLVIDPFAGDWSATTADLKPLKVKANGGRRLVLCYVSIGEAESYRFYWKKDWKPGKPAFIGPENPQWKQNFAARYWEPAWQAVFVGGAESYLGRVLAAGFDGVYLDKVDEYEWFEEHRE